MISLALAALVMLLAPSDLCGLDAFVYAVGLAATVVFVPVVLGKLCAILIHWWTDNDANGYDAREVMPDEAVRSVPGQPELHAVTGGAHPTNAPCKRHKIRGVAVGTHTIVNEPETCIVCGARVSPLSAEIILDRINQ